MRGTPLTQAGDGSYYFRTVHAEPWASWRPSVHAPDQSGTAKPVHLKVAKHPAR